MFLLEVSRDYRDGVFFFLTQQDNFELNCLLCLVPMKNLNILFLGGSRAPGCLLPGCRPFYVLGFYSPDNIGVQSLVSVRGSDVSQVWLGVRTESFRDVGLWDRGSFGVVSDLA